MTGTAAGLLALFLSCLSMGTTAGEAGLQPRLVPQLGHDQAPAAIIYSPHGRHIVTAGGTVLLWDASSGDLLRRFEAKTSGFQCAAISPPMTDRCLPPQ